MGSCLGKQKTVEKKMDDVINGGNNKPHTPSSGGTLPTPTAQTVTDVKTPIYNYTNSNNIGSTNKDVIKIAPSPMFYNNNNSNNNGSSKDIMQMVPSPMYYNNNSINKTNKDVVQIAASPMYYKNDSNNTGKNNIISNGLKSPKQIPFNSGVTPTWKKMGKTPIYGLNRNVPPPPTDILNYYTPSETNNTTNGIASPFPIKYPVSFKGRESLSVPVTVGPVQF